jgi:hypothetical protein
MSDVNIKGRKADHSPEFIKTDDDGNIYALLVANDGSVTVQNPLPVDGDSVYAKDINVSASDIGDFSGVVTDLFDSLQSTIVDSTATDPKEISVKFTRPLDTGVFRMCTHTGDFSNVKILLKDGSGLVVGTIDDSSNSTKKTSAEYVITPTPFCNFVVQFHTSDTVTLGWLGIDKSLHTHSQLMALKPDGTGTFIDATAGGNLKTSIEEVEAGVVLPTQQIVSQEIQQAINVINSTYGDTVSVDAKQKNLLKFGSRTTVGATWETMMSTQGSELQETLLSSNGITTIVSSTSDTQDVKIEYHTISGSDLTFGVQTATLTSTTPVVLDTACARVSRIYNNSATALAGNIYVYEGGSRTDANTHAYIPAGEQQTQKAATSISSVDYWILTHITMSILAKTTKYGEFRIEVRLPGQNYWKPVTQTFGCNDTIGTVDVEIEPYAVIPKNSDVRVAAQTNTGSVSVAGGFNGYLASIV